jgi:hypothetical protein
MDHDVDFLMMYPMLLLLLLLDELKMLNMVQWNVDDDNQHNNDDNQFVEMTHQHLILVAKKNIFIFLI